MGVDGNDDVPCPEPHGCQQACRLVGVSTVETCFCEDGFDMTDKGDCADTEECAEDNGGCAHGCKNKPGTYTCEGEIFLTEAIHSCK